MYFYLFKKKFKYCNDVNVNIDNSDFPLNSNHAPRKNCNTLYCIIVIDK